MTLKFLYWTDNVLKRTKCAWNHRKGVWLWLQFTLNDKKNSKKACTPPPERELKSLFEVYKNYVNINCSLMFFYIFSDALRTDLPCRDDQRTKRSILTEHPLIFLLKPAHTQWTDYEKRKKKHFCHVRSRPALTHYNYQPDDCTPVFFVCAFCGWWKMQHGAARFFPAVKKIAFWESDAPLIKSHNLLVKAGILSERAGGPPGLYNCTAVSPEMPQVKMKRGACESGFVSPGF